MRLAVVMAATVAGAALLSSLHPASRTAYEAAGAIVIPIRGQSAADVRLRTRQAAEIVRQPSTVGEALESVLQDPEPAPTLRGLKVRAQPAAGVVGFSVRGPTAGTARDLAAALGRVTVGVLERGQRLGDRFGLRIVGDFEVDAEGWAGAGSGNALAAVGLVHGGRYGRGALRARCTPSAGCGAARVLEGVFAEGEGVTLTAWVRARSPSRALLVLGSAARPEFEEAPVAATREWKRVVVRWAPTRDERELAVQVVNDGSQRLDVEIDGVLLITDGDALTLGREEQLFTQREHAYLAPIRVVRSHTARTLKWALIGAGGGFMVGMAGVAAGALTRRRQSIARRATPSSQAGRGRDPEQEPDA